MFFHVQSINYHLSLKKLSHFIEQNVTYKPDSEFYVKMLWKTQQKQTQR